MEMMHEFCSMFILCINLEKSRAMASRHLPIRKKISMRNFTSMQFINDIGRYLGLLLLKGRAKWLVFSSIF